jgi:uncharacterized protein YuzE
MKVTYDKQADAMYIYMEEIKPKGVDQTISLNEDINVDFDKNKKIIGIEILSASKNLAKKQLKQVEQISV